MGNENGNEYLARLGFANEYPVVIADIGNFLCKVLTDSPIKRGANPLDFVSYPHAIAEVDSGAYERLLRRYHGKKGYHLLKWRERCYVIGEQAYSVDMHFEPRQGRLKYSRDYYGLLFIRGLVELFDGSVPEAVNAFLAHPPGDLEFTDVLKRAVHGRWVFEVNGQRCETTVVYSNTFDEIVGGVHNAVDGPDGQRMAENALEGNGPALVFDLGGGSLDLCYLTSDLAVNYDRGLFTERTGINSAVETFKSIFDATYKNRLSDAENGIARGHVIDIFMDEEHAIYDAGEKIDCVDIYNEAIAPVIRASSQAVKRFAGGFMGINSVLLTGGGSAMVMDEIKREIFAKFDKNGKVFTTAERAKLVQANVRGGRKIAEAMKSVSAVEAARWLKAQGNGKR